MAEVDFSNPKHAEDWYWRQSIDLRCLVSSRAALRVVALIGHAHEDHKEKLALAAFRAILTSTCRSAEQSKDAKELERAALFAAVSLRGTCHSHAASRFARDFVDSAALAAVTAAFSAAPGGSHQANGYLADSADFARAIAFLSAHAADTADKHSSQYALSILAEDAKDTVKNMSSIPVWRQEDAPSIISEAYQTWMKYLSHPDWAFWRRWYAQMWEGTFRDWDLAIEVAKIPDEVWEGEDALAKVAEAIRGIEARLALKSAISDFRQSVETVGKEDAQLNRGHNNPPELIDDAPLVSQREIVWAAIDDLEREVEKEKPNKELVRQSVGVIARWVADVLRYLGRKADRAIDQSINWGVPLGGTYLLANPAKLQHIIETGKAWLPFLP